jgi:hypothetical protein
VKVSEAKAICPHFNPVRKPSDGRIACRFALPDDMCRHDQHFLCDLKQITKAPKKYLSVSRIKLWEECPRKWAFRYAYHLDPPDGRPLWAYVGSAFATARAKIDAGQEWEIPDDVEDEVERIKLGAVMKGYMQLPKMVDKSEVRVETLLDGDRGLWLLGYLDGITENETTIYEWKFTAMPANWNILTVHMQGAAYLHAVPKAEMLILALAKKPSRFKPRKGESIEEFKERLESEVLKDHKKWFSFKTFKREEFDVAGTIDQMLTHYQDSQDALVTHTFYPNYGACDNFSGCEWKAYCKTHCVRGIGCEDPDCSHPALCARVKLERDKAF